MATSAQFLDVVTANLATGSHVRVAVVHEAC